MARFGITIDVDCTVRLSGDLDMAAAVDFARIAGSALDGRRELVLDMTRLEFLDSSGIRAIVDLAMRTDRGILLRGPNRTVRRAIDLTGIVGQRGIRLEDRTSRVPARAAGPRPSAP
jgi:anti-anti-sigma factor